MADKSTLSKQPGELQINWSQLGYDIERSNRLIY